MILSLLLYKQIKNKIILKTRVIGCVNKNEKLFCVFSYLDRNVPLEMLLLLCEVTHPEYELSLI